MSVEIQGVAAPAFEIALGQLGEEGWELVGAVQRARRGYSQQVHLLLKRPAEPRVVAPLT